MLDKFKIDSKKYLILPHFKFFGNEVVFLDKHKFFNSNIVIGLNDNEKINLLLEKGVIVRKNSNKAKSKKSKKRILVIEPHPDDFALSAMGFALSKKWSEVKILNIFSRTSIKNFPWGDKFSISESKFERMRIIESRLAIEKYLNFNFESLRLPLAQKRGHENNYCTNETKSEAVLVDMLSRKILDEISKKNYDFVLCPLGIQNHIDHMVVFDSCIVAYKMARNEGHKTKFIFYEEYPYSRNRKLLNNRMQYLYLFFKFQKKIIAVDDYLEVINDAITIYRTQFDNISPGQMLEIIKNDYNLTANEEIDLKNSNAKLCQRYYELKKII